jgi:hypothetical protein
MNGEFSNLFREEPTTPTTSGGEFAHLFREAETPRLFEHDIETDIDPSELIDPSRLTPAEQERIRTRGHLIDFQDVGAPWSPLSHPDGLSFRQQMQLETAETTEGKRQRFAEMKEGLAKHGMSFVTVTYDGQRVPAILSEDGASAIPLTPGFFAKYANKAIDVLPPVAGAAVSIAAGPATLVSGGITAGMGSAAGEVGRQIARGMIDPRNVQPGDFVTDVASTGVENFAWYWGVGKIADIVKAVAGLSPIEATKATIAGARTLINDPKDTILSAVLSPTGKLRKLAELVRGIFPGVKEPAELAARQQLAKEGVPTLLPTSGLHWLRQMVRDTTRTEPFLTESRRASQASLTALMQRFGKSPEEASDYARSMLEGVDPGEAFRVGASIVGPLKGEMENLERMLSRTSPTMDFGKRLGAAIDDIVTRFKKDLGEKPFEGWLNDVDALLTSRGVKLDPNIVRDRVATLQGEYATSLVGNRVRSLGSDELFRRYGGLQDVSSVKQIYNTHSALMEDMTNRRLLHGTSEHDAGAIADSMDEMIKDGLRKTGPEGETLIRELDHIRDDYRHARAVFDEDLYTKVANGYKSDLNLPPDTISNMMLAVKSPDVLSRLRSQVPPDIWAMGQDAVADKMIRDVMGRSGMIRPGALRSYLDDNKYNLNAIFGDDVVSGWRKTADELLRGHISAPSMREAEEGAKEVRALDTYISEGDNIFSLLNKPNERVASILASPGRRALLERVINHFGDTSTQTQNIRQMAVHRIIESAWIPEKYTGKLGFSSKALNRSLSEYTRREQELLFPGESLDAVKDFSVLSKILFTFAENEGAVGLVSSGPIRATLPASLPLVKMLTWIDELLASPRVADFLFAPSKKSWSEALKDLAPSLHGGVSNELAGHLYRISALLSAGYTLSDLANDQSNTVLESDGGQIED